MLRTADLAQRPDLHLGDLRISPSRRRVEGPTGAVHIEPQVIRVFLRLLSSAGQVVTRGELFDECWGGAAVGDDSLNQAIRGARQIATSVGSQSFAIEAIPRTGYILSLAKDVCIVEAADCEPRRGDALQIAVENAYDCWRSGLPVADFDALRDLSDCLDAGGGDARSWGMYALLLRKAAEYADHDRCAEFVQSCERAARRAFAFDERQSDARVALAGVVPLFGNWSAAREQLAAVRRDDADHVPAAHDMAVLEMATGRPSAARPIIEELLERDPLAATFYYKRMFHLWTFGDIAGLDLVASRAMQLWPKHPAIWLARLWTLVFTERAGQAAEMLADEQWRPPLPPQAVDLLTVTCAVVDAKQKGLAAAPAASNLAISKALDAASRGPSHAVAGFISLCALDAVGEALDVAQGYFCGRGRVATPLRWNAGDPSVTDQHRRVTQLLFIPSAAALREHSGFASLCDDIGLSDYWEKSGVTPDFMASGR